jgi:hypothetical protein
MAAITGCRIQCEVVAYMAGRAGGRRRRDMEACQSPSRRAVVKR